MNNINNLVELLEQLPAEELDRMLQSELQKKPVDEDAVRMILRVLKKQDEEQAVAIDAGVQKAWEKYQHDVKASQPKSVPKKNWLLRIAAAAAVLCLVLLAAPQAAEAESFIGMLTRWTDSIFEFFDPKERDTNQLEYEFKTDHPGLQQVYDAVVETGVTDPVVPMWLPEGFELVALDTYNTSRKSSVAADFTDGSSYLVYQLDIYDDNVARTYQKDESFVGTHEIMGTVHTILKNNGRWVAVWSTEHVESTFTIDCQEDVFYEILKSIYEMEVE